MYNLISPALPPEVHTTSLDTTLSPFSSPWKTSSFLTVPVSRGCYCNLQISISVSCFIQNVQGNSLLHLAWPQQLPNTLMFPKLLPTLMSVMTPRSAASSRYTLDCWTTGDVVSVCHSAWTWDVPSPASLTLACTLEVLTYLGTLRWVSVFTPLDFDRWCAPSSSWGTIQIIAVWWKCILGHQSPWAVSKASLLCP